MHLCKNLVHRLMVSTSYQHCRVFELLKLLGHRSLGGVLVAEVQLIYETILLKVEFPHLPFQLMFVDSIYQACSIFLILNGRDLPLAHSLISHTDRKKPPIIEGEVNALDVGSMASEVHADVILHRVNTPPNVDVSILISTGDHVAQITQNYRHHGGRWVFGNQRVASDPR